MKKKISLYDRYSDAVLWHLVKDEIIRVHPNEYSSYSNEVFQKRILKNRSKTAVLRLLMIYEDADVILPISQRTPYFDNVDLLAKNYGIQLVNRFHDSGLIASVIPPKYLVKEFLVSVLTPIKSILADEFMRVNDNQDNYVYDLFFRRVLRNNSELVDLETRRNLIEYFIVNLIPEYWCYQVSETHESVLEKVSAESTGFTKVIFEIDWKEVHQKKLIKGLQKPLEFFSPYPDGDDHIHYMFFKQLEAIVKDYFYLLVHSIENDAVISQSIYDFSILDFLKINDVSINEAKYGLEAYSLIKLSLKDRIAALPRLETFEDLQSLKERKYKEIARLREILFLIESGIAEGNEGIGKLVDNEVDLALRDLQRGEVLSKVSSWSTYLSIPVTSIEMILGIPSVVGITAGVLGTFSTYRSNNLINRSSWINVVG